MSAQQRIRGWLHDVLAAGERPTIDEAVAAVMRQRDLIDAEYQDGALQRALKADLRKMAIEDDEEGLPFALSISRIVDGRARREYVALTLFEPDDYKDALRSAAKRLESAQKSYVQLAHKAHEAAGIKLVVPTIRWQKAA